mmetsp:Transcript_12291/g.17844  ORF Transcript_12291/g.17844 Transcript_12291/m.17844 type:complete len:288 (-) Transcript_12291:481-1344(-)
MYLGFCSGANLNSLARVVELDQGLGHGKRTICKARADDDSRSSRIARKVVAFGTWGSLVSYAAFFKPSSLLDTSPVVEELLKIPLLPDMNPIYYAIFLFIPSYVLLYAATLLPAWRIQKWPTSAFLALATAIGSGALLPYLGLRNYTTQPDPDFTKGKESFMENRWIAASLIAAGVGLYANAFGLFDGRMEMVDFIFIARWMDYANQFRIDPLVHFSSIDFIVLWLSFIDPLVEDMRRRRMFTGDPQDYLTVALIMTVPFLGPCFYLLTRPEADTFGPRELKTADEE